jgi:hypothetical protein
MVSTLIILAVSATALAVSWSLLLQNRQPKIFTIHDWEEKRHPIDVRVFRRLIDPNEEHYLQLAMPRDQFAYFQRRRTQFALRMLKMAKQNAEMLTRLGALARAADDPVVAREADQLIAAATQLRFNLLLAKYCLWVKWAFPSWTFSLPAVETHYQYLLESFLRVQQHI